MRTWTKELTPLVWSHQHNDVNDVLGHALLENREEGVYAYCKFNDTESRQTAKLLVQHGDVNALSIYANQLQRIPTPKKIIFNENYQVTVVLWEDGTKTIVRCAENTTPDPYAAYCAAFTKKCYGSNSKLKKTIKKLMVLQDTKVKKENNNAED